jgi:hypothetical protein
MSLDKIIVLVFVLGAIGALVGVNLNSRRKAKQEKPETPGAPPQP